MSTQWGRRAGDAAALRPSYATPPSVQRSIDRRLLGDLDHWRPTGLVNGAAVVDTPDENERRAQDVHRLRELIADVVTVGYAQTPPAWLTDELWQRLIAEVPGVPVKAAPDEQEGLFA